MRTSVKYKNISKDTSNLVQELLRNQEFLRYLTYLGEEYPLSKKLRDVDGRKAREKNFRFTLFNDKILEDKQVTVFVTPIKQDFEGVTLSNDYYQFDIVIPNDDWIIENDCGFELRAFELAHQVAVSLDDKTVAGVGEVNIIQSNVQSILYKYSILSIILSVRNSKI